MKYQRENVTKEVLELARPRSSPIHEFFTWDDTAAAEQYRLKQAQTLISCLVVEIENIEYRKYVTPCLIEETGSKAYVEINKARATPEIWEQILDRAMNDAILFRERYNHLKELGPIITAISKVEKSLKRRSARWKKLKFSRNKKW